MDPYTTSSVTHKATAHFGRTLIASVRDYVIHELDRMVDEGLTQEDDEDSRALMAKLGPEAKTLLKRVIPMFVDTTLHYVMFMFEHPTHHGIRISVTMKDGEIFPDLNAVSDGLAGDLVAWIHAFAKERHKPFPGSQQGEE